MLSELLSAIAASMNSQLVGGGLVLLLSGAALALLRFVPRVVMNFVQRQFVTKLDVVGDDMAYSWLNAWLDKHPYSKKARAITVVTSHRGDDARAQFVPAPGMHVFWYKRRPILLLRTRTEKQNTGYHESMTLRTFGRSPAVLHALIREAQRVYDKPTSDVTIYTSHQEYWQRVGSFSPRPLSSVVLAEGIVERVRDDLKEFLESRKWYDARGIPWRRGYLLQGPPGTGKSSLISALSGDLGLNLYVPNLRGSSLTDDAFVNLLLNVPKGSVVLLEDIDALVQGREVNNGEGLSASTLSFSGLLNALDGVASRPGLVLFMTTNHPEVLDPALIRPGRIDVTISVGAPTREQALRLYRHFYGDVAVDEDAERFADAATCGQWKPSMAELQQLLILHKAYPICAVHAAMDRSRGVLS